MVRHAQIERLYQDKMILKKVCAKLYCVSNIQNNTCTSAVHLNKNNPLITEKNFNGIIKQLLEIEVRIRTKRHRDMFKYSCLLVIMIRYDLLRNKIYSFYSDEDYKTGFDLNFERLMRLFYHKYLNKTLDKVSLLPSYEKEIKYFGMTKNYSISGWNDCVITSFKLNGKKYADIHSIFDTYGRIAVVYVGKLKMKKIRQMLRETHYTDFYYNPRGKHYHYSFVLATCPITDRKIIRKLFLDILQLKTDKEDMLSFEIEGRYIATKEEMQMVKFYNGVGWNSADYDCMTQECNCPRPINAPGQFEREIRDYLFDKMDYIACLKQSQKVNKYQHYINSNLRKNPAIISFQNGEF